MKPEPEKLPNYKNAVSVTGQVFFCAAPIRLDAYNGCEFACAYCFSRRRSKMTAAKGVRRASPSAFSGRLKRVDSGQIASALDEFLARRVPVQLGGLHDPFTERERQHRVTRMLLDELLGSAYPTLISTKSVMPREPDYLERLKEMHVLVRFSAAAVSDRARPFIDRKCPPFEAVLATIERLAKCGVRTGLRLQPVFPDSEEDALHMTRSAANAGVLQVSYEYLKLPIEISEAEFTAMNRALGFNLRDRMRELGLRGIGRDAALRPTVKRRFLLEARALCHALGIRFGAGDTEFIAWSDGVGCCGSSDLLPGDAHQFSANFTGLIKRARRLGRSKIRLSDLADLWSPDRPISTYLDSRSRSLKRMDLGLTDWMALLSARWNGGRSPYAPDFFDGVYWTGERDQHGDKVYAVETELSRPASP